MYVIYFIYDGLRFSTSIFGPFLADRTAYNMSGYWHRLSSVCLSVCHSVCLLVSVSLCIVHADVE